MIGRRRFLIASAASAALAGCSKLSFLEQAPTIHYPGMHDGHWLRDAHALPSPAGELVVDVVILGSGMAALTAAWQLARQGHRRFMVLSGPEFGGNAAGGRFGELAFPRGAHYLPLPSAGIGARTRDPRRPWCAYQRSAGGASRI